MIFYPNKYYVYSHTLNGQVVYIGKGTNERAFNVKARNQAWNKALTKKDHFNIDIIQWFDDEADALSFERDLQRLVKPSCDFSTDDKSKAEIKYVESKKYSKADPNAPVSEISAMSLQRNRYTDDLITVAAERLQISKNEFIRNACLEITSRMGIY